LKVAAEDASGIGEGKEFHNCSKTGLLISVSYFPPHWKRPVACLEVT